MSERFLIRRQLHGLDLGGDDGRHGKIRGHGDIGGLVIAPRFGDEALHLDHAIFRGYDGVAACRLRRNIDEIAELAVAQRVMRDLVQPLILIRRHAHEMKDQRMLGLGAHNAIER